MHRLLVFVVAIVTSVSTLAYGHDMWGMANPAVNDPTVNVDAEFAAVAARAPNDSRARFILERALLWSPGAQLRACFLNGDSTDRSHVIQAATDLQLFQKGVNVRIEFVGDCRPDTPEEIRISFNHGCCAAYVGRVALHPTLKGGPTVFLRSELPLHIIQHELLHTLAVHHEHQNPIGANCFEQLIDVEAYARANGWDAKTVKANLEVFGRHQRKFMWSQERDTASIMHYSIAASYLKGGRSNPCFLQANTRLSEGDYEGLRAAYPLGDVGLTARRAGVEALRSVSLPSNLVNFLNVVPLD